MRFQINCQQLATLMLASCAISASIFSMSAVALAQQSGPIELSISDNEPSRSSEDAVKGDESKTRTESKDGKKGQDATQKDGSGTDKNSLTPVQNRDLTTNVHVVDMSVAGLGTGAVPDAAFDKRKAERPLGRLMKQKCVYWHPSSICHYPLRFEETMLERHGHVRLGCLQPLVSGVRFFTTIPMLPYLNTLQPHYQPVYALGNYRPGSSAPLVRDTIPYDKHAAVVEAMSVAGFFWAMPL